MACVGNALSVRLLPRAGRLAPDLGLGGDPAELPSWPEYFREGLEREAIRLRRGLPDPALADCLGGLQPVCAVDGGKGARVGDLLANLRASFAWV